MAFYRCGGGGIPSSLKTDMNAVLNKKFGTSSDYPPADWAPTVNLMGPLPEKTIVSSPIADFSDGADDVPTKSLIVTISPTLSGVSSVTETQTGRNLADGTNFTRGLPSTTNGASIETIAASTRYAYIGISAKGANYTISSVSTDTDYFYNILIFGYTNGLLAVYTNTNAGTDKTVDFSACDYIRLAIGTRSASYQVPTDLTEYGTIQLEVGSTAHAYEPYQTPTTYPASLGRTIYGGTADIVNGVGTDENGNDFTFDGQEIPTRLGYNAFWSDEGDTEVTYRADINLALGGQ